MLIHILKIIKNNLRANLLLVAGIFVIATSLWYAVDYVYAGRSTDRNLLALNGKMSITSKWAYYLRRVWNEIQPLALPR